MPVSLLEWRVRIGRFVQNPPVINRLEMIEKFLERWKLKKEKAAASQPSTGDQTHCEMAEAEESNMAPPPTSTQTQTPRESTKKEKSKIEASPPSTQSQTPCRSARKGKSKIAASPPSTQDETPCTCRMAEEENTKVAFNPPCQSASKGKSNMAASEPSSQDQTSCHLAKKGKSEMAANKKSTHDQTPCLSAKKGKPKMAASPTSAQDQTPCQPAKKCNSKMTASQSSTQDETPWESAKERKSKVAGSPLATQDQTTCESAKEEKSEMADSPSSIQDQILYKSAMKRKSKMAACQPSTQDQKACRSAEKGKSNMASNPPSPQDKKSFESPWKDESKMEARPLSTQDQAICESAKKDRLKKTASPPSLQDQTTCESTKIDNSNLTAGPPSTQVETTCKSAKKGKSEIAASPPSTQTQTPCRSAKKGKSKIAACPPSPQDEIPCKSRKDESKIETSPPFTQNQTPCESAKKGKSKIAARPTSMQDQTPCQLAMKGKSKMAVSLPSTQDKTSCKSAMEGKSKMAGNPLSPQDETPCKSPRKDKSKMEASLPFTPNQTPCQPAKKGKSKVAASPQSTQDETPWESAQEGKSKVRGSVPPSQDETPCESPRKDESKIEASPPSSQDQATCESTKSDNSKMAASPPSTQDESPCESAKEGRSKMATSPPCESARKGKEKMASSLSYTHGQTSCDLAEADESRKPASPLSPLSSQDQTLCESSEKENAKMAASPSSNPHQALHIFQSTEIEISKNASSQPSAQVQNPCQSTKRGNSRIGASPASKFTEKEESNMAASLISTHDQTQCESTKKGASEIAASAPSPPDQGQCESSKKENTKKSVSPSSQSETSCGSEKKGKSKMTACSLPSTQDQAACESAKKEKTKVASSQPCSQICQLKSLSCPQKAILVWSLANTGSCVLSCIAQVLLMLLTLMACFQLRREQPTPVLCQPESPAETSQSPRTKEFVPTSSCFSCGMGFCRSMISYIVCGFCHLYMYLPMILLVRSGDVETNPGPNTVESTVSEMEFSKLAHDIPPSYYTAVGVSLGIPYEHLEAILIEKLNNYPNAFMTVFMKWNVMQQPPNTNKREVLADALRENDMGDLSERLRYGRLLPDMKGGSSRLPESQSQLPPSESLTKRLSPEMIEQCANDFKFKYRSTICKIRADPLDPASLVQFEDIDINLALKEDHGRRIRALDYNDLLELKVNGQFVKRFMVQGEAGAGKTTLCAKIAWDWIEKKYFKKFVWVLIVPLCDAKQYTLGQIAKSYLSRNNPATACQLSDYIRSNPEKVFIAFDGLDEFSGKGISKSDGQQSQPPLQPSQSRASSTEACGSPPQTSDIVLEDILCSVELTSCPVLVTTRPLRAVEIRSDEDLMKLYTFIHVEGLSGKNLSVYIHKYFAQDEAEANQLIHFMFENAISENLDHYPIYVAMLCLMWKGLCEQRLQKMKSLQTFSQIFKEVIGFLKEHYAHKMIKKVDSPSLIACLKQIDKLLEPVAKQAFTGLLKNTLVFSDSDFHSCPESLETACRVGILSQEDRIISDNTSGVISRIQFPVYFPHKLFQEYMAGVYLASLYESDRSEFNRLIDEVALPWKEEFRYLLYFTVSQNKTIAHCVMESLIQKYEPPPAGLGWDANRDLIVDVAFESQDPDAAALVKYKVSSPGMELRIDFSMTAHTVAGYTFTRPYVDTLCVDGDYGPSVSLNMAEMICSTPSLKRVSLRASFHSHFSAVLAQKGRESKVQTLEVLGVKCPTPASSHLLAEALFSLPSLTDLTLGVIDHSDEFYSTLKARSSSLKVETLEIVGVECPTSASSHDLAEALCSMPNMTDLTLHRIDSGEFYSTLKARTSTIEGCFPQISKGNFRFNGSPVESLESFLLMLSDYQGGETSQLWSKSIHSTTRVEETVPHDKGISAAHHEFLTDTPPDLILQEDEAIIACGIRFSPSGAKLTTPVKVTLDHNAHFTNPQKADIVFYTKSKGMTTFERVPSSSEGYPHCEVRAKDLDLYVDHFCQWWIVASIKRYFVGKRVNCTPYVKPPVCKGRIHTVILYIYDDLLEIEKKVTARMAEYTMLHPPKPLFVEWSSGDVMIKLYEGLNEPREQLKEMRMTEQKFYQVSCDPQSFCVPSPVGEANQKPLQFILCQSNSTSASDEINIVLEYDDRVHQSVSQLSRSPSLPSLRSPMQLDLEMDEKLNELARHIPHHQYPSFCEKLGINFNRSDNILQTNQHDYCKATRACLADWKNRTAGTLDDLKQILIDADLQGLLRHLQGNAS